MLDLITWVATIASFIAGYLNIHKRVSGFYVWAVCDILLMGVNYLIGQYAQALLFGFYTAINIYGMYMWRQNETA